MLEKQFILQLILIGLILIVIAVFSGLL